MQTTTDMPKDTRGRKKTGRLGEILIKENLITPDQLKQALERQRKRGGRLGSNVVKLGFLTGDEITAVLSRQCGIPSIGLDNFLADPSLVGLIPMETALKLRVLPLSRVGLSLTVAMADPSNTSIVDDIKVMTGLNIEPVVASEVSLDRAIKRNYGSVEEEERRKEIQELTSFVVEEQSDDAEAEDETVLDLEAQAKAAEEAPVIRLVNYILTDAIQRGASDIHLEPCEKEYRVRYRIDGALLSTIQPPVKVRNAIIGRIKTMAKLDANEKMLPQEGRARVRLLRNGKKEEVDFRISVLPTLQGEKIVLRSLNKEIFHQDMAGLGFEPAAQEKFQRALSSRGGMVLVTGPAGSGRTTTLYSAILQLNRPEVDILTAEDPVEFQLPGISQVEVKEKIGFNFAAALRSFLRQDPDVIMVGGMPDSETAEIAVKAALTGHLVLSTLPADDTVSAILRLLAMRVEPFAVATAVHLVCAQRLVRRICPECKVEDSVGPQVLFDAGFTAEEVSTVKVFHGRGCSACSNNGYKGRVGLYEVLEVTDELRQLILAGDSALELRKKAIDQGMTILRRSGLLKVAAGITTLEEVIRETAL